MMCSLRLTLAAALCLTLNSCALANLPLGILKALGNAATLGDNQPQHRIHLDQSDFEKAREVMEIGPVHKPQPGPAPALVSSPSSGTLFSP